MSSITKPAEPRAFYSGADMSLAVNPRATVYPSAALIQITYKCRHDRPVDAYRAKLALEPWATHRVRQIYSAPCHADRAVEKLGASPKVCGYGRAT